jgi:hypothetical protein
MLWLIDGSNVNTISVTDYNGDEVEFKCEQIGNDTLLYLTGLNGSYNFSTSSIVNVKAVLMNVDEIKMIQRI